MKRKFEAKIYWLPESQGGRKCIPVDNKYAPQIYVKKSFDEVTPWSAPIDAWSIFVLNKHVLDENETVADLEYLSERAPDNLSKGVKFELREGNKLVARGVILEN